MQQAMGILTPKNTYRCPDSSKCIGYDVVTSSASNNKPINESVLVAKHYCYCYSVSLATEIFDKPFHRRSR